MELTIAPREVSDLSGNIKLGNVYCNEMGDLKCIFDILGLVEAWETVQSNIKLPRYSHLNKRRRNRFKKGRSSGCLVLYLRKNNNINSGRCL